MSLILHHMVLIVFEGTLNFGFCALHVTIYLLGAVDDP